MYTGSEREREREMVRHEWKWHSRQKVCSATVSDLCLYAPAAEERVREVYIKSVINSNRNDALCEQ